MKKAIIALYVIVAVQTILIILAFVINYGALREVAKRIIEIGDERYVHQQ